MDDARPADQPGRPGGRGRRGGAAPRRGAADDRSGGTPPRRAGGATRGEAPPRRPPRPRRDDTTVPRPDLPDDHDVTLPRGVRREVERAARGAAPRDVLVALSVGSAALDAEDGATARPYLEWARQCAPRSATVREAVGVARYLTEDFAGALAELRAYRRLSGAADQNHVIADCMRAVGRDIDGIGALIDEMRTARDDRQVPSDRVTEGVIVWASALADRGDIAAGRRQVAARVAELADRTVDEEHLRLWYVAGDLAERAGDTEAARTSWARIHAVAPDFFDVGERLDRCR